VSHAPKGSLKIPLGSSLGDNDFEATATTSYILLKIGFIWTSINTVIVTLKHTLLLHNTARYTNVKAWGIDVCSSVTFYKYPCFLPMAKPKDVCYTKPHISNMT